MEIILMIYIVLILNKIKIFQENVIF